MTRGGATLCAAALAICAAPSLAQSYPAKPIRLVLPFAGGTDVVGRLIALKLSPALGQQVVPDPRLGAGDFDQSYLVARLKLGRDVEADRFGLNGRLPRSACDAVLGAHLNTSIAREAWPKPWPEI